MEKSKLKKIIKEVLDESFQSSKNVKDYPNIKKDDVGIFWVVIEASHKSTIDDVIFELDLVGFSEKFKRETDFSAILGIYKNKSEATKEAHEVLLNAQRGLKEIETSMSEFRKNKLELAEKQKMLADKIKGIKR